MTNQFRTSVLQVGFGVFALCIASFCQPASASGDHLGALDAKVSVLTKSAFVQGEPIILHYLISNTSDQKLGLDWEGKEGYSLTLTDQTGAMNVIQQKHPTKRGAYAELDPFMCSGGKYETYFAVPQRDINLHPGRYTLIVHVRLPYAMAESNEENPLVIKKQIKGSGNVFSRVFRFPLIVTAPNDGVLRARAASLLKSISTLPYGPEYIANMDALFSMPEVQAVAIWRELATHPNTMNASLIADRLGDVSSVKASDLLLKMLDNPALPPAASMLVSRKLAEVYNSGSAGVRSHLKNTMASRGSYLPDKIAVSQLTD